MISSFPRLPLSLATFALFPLLGAGQALAQVSYDASKELVPRVIARPAGEKRMLPDGRFILLKVGPANSGSSYLFMGYEDLPPGTAIPRHRHELDEEILIVHRGRVVVILNADTATAQAGDALFLPPRTWVSVRSPGPDTAAIFFIFPRATMEACFRFVGHGEGESPHPQTPRERDEEGRVCRWSY
jgi:quercetin dioxygenase-like cupin family protein